MFGSFDFGYGSSVKPTNPLPADVRPRSGVLVVTDETDDEALARARAVAAEMAARAEVPLVLYDRSEETWGDTPHPEGPLAVDDPRLEDREHLCEQMLEARQLHADPKAWVATLPTISAIETAIVASGSDVIVVAKEMPPNLFERILSGDTLAEKIIAARDPRLEQDVTVVAVGPDGSTEVVGHA